ncbi:MAG: histidinol-phosphatase HisJ family protein [Lachnospiraceae bacterium]|jgi:histidinol-phosphatase (PHP family)|nr:histidinol-phosphatase HisJ family protein [Lachnospiraceae bacterium]
MIPFDTHIHTYPFSQDAHQSITDVVGMNATSHYGYVITEHMDYNYVGKMNFEFKPEEYFKLYSPYRNDRFLLGVEMGLQPDNFDKIAKALSNYPFDMVIGSIHTVGGDIAHKEYYDKLTKNESYTNYLVRILECLENFHDFDTLGHIDYICRYSPYDDPELHVSEYKAALVAIFNFLIDHNMCLEINTRRLDTKTGFDTLNEIMRLYAFLGGRLVTVGSDSHKVENLSKNFDKAEKIIAEHGFTPVYFKERKRIEM